MEEIGATGFYGGRSHLPPALNTVRAHNAALGAARRDDRRLYKLFPIQDAAFRFADAKPHLELSVWAYEIDGKGRRRYVVASHESFWRWYKRCLRRNAVLHLYEVIRTGSAVRLYFDLEFKKSCNPGLCGKRLLDALHKAVQDLAGSPSEHVVLDSTTDSKWSKHVIFQRIAFYDAMQAGDFAARVVEGIGEEALVATADGSRTPFVDLAVYSRNRCFRIVASSKYGKSARLLPEGHPKEGRLSISEELFFNALVCNVSPDVRILGSPRRIPRDKPIVRRSVSHVGNEEMGETMPPPSKLDQYIQSIVGITGINTVTQMRGAFSYSIKGSYKYCHRIGRHHKSNNIILVVDVVTRQVFQKCFDPECRDFVSDPWDVPPHVFEVAVTDDEIFSHEQLNQMLDELDEKIGKGKCGKECTSQQDYELSDEVLNALMDRVEGNSFCGKECAPKQDVELSDEMLNTLMDRVEAELPTVKKRRTT